MNDTATCSVQDCARSDKITKGLCHLHYERMRTRGTTAPPDAPTPAERLTAGLALADNGCMVWTKFRNAKGYGRIRVNGFTLLTHRMAWEQANGPILDDALVLHRCDNPPCAQTEPTEGYPEGHLFLGTNDDNMADMSVKGRGHWQKKTHCPKGHPYDEVNTYVNPRGARMCRTCARDKRQ